mmetsp:Transcript_57394/g.186442  ORF Transcript_57394/g.186442 Transcript_57394/m.186442 type:complete len:294 (+) Transcript_57394:786-1667(+)
MQHREGLMHTGVHLGLGGPVLLLLVVHPQDEGRPGRSDDQRLRSRRQPEDLISEFATTDKARPPRRTALGGREAVAGHRRVGEMGKFELPAHAVAAVAGEEERNPATAHVASAIALAAVGRVDLRVRVQIVDPLDVDDNLLRTRRLKCEVGESMRCVPNDIVGDEASVVRVLSKAADKKCFDGEVDSLEVHHRSFEKIDLLRWCARVEALGIIFRSHLHHNVHLQRRQRVELSLVPLRNPIEASGLGAHAVADPHRALCKGLPLDAREQLAGEPSPGPQVPAAALSPLERQLP